MYALFVAPPLDAPVGTVFHINEGASVEAVAQDLKAKHVIQSIFVFKISAYLFAKGGVQAGTYALHGENVVRLVYRLGAGESGLESVSVTIPEGSTVRDMGVIFEKTLGDFDSTLFVRNAKEKEGYLFPDTYHFVPGTAPSVVIGAMARNYEEKIEPLRTQIVSSTFTEHEIITMASLLEREARQYETKRVVAGILWKRIELGMPLQVDAVFGYIFNRETYSPSLEDLEVDSPYNTYTHRGLPPGPIANPGLDSIRAALNPSETPYLYYLTGKDGKMYYARTFDQHVANRVHLR
jgi:UPF0755 protein